MVQSESLTEMVFKAFRKPKLAAWRINYHFGRTIMPYIRKPVSVFEEEWDNLVILDGCRYDLISEEQFQDGNVNFRWSGGADSEEFLEYNVEGRTLENVVWVTANPFVADYTDSIFKVVNLWDSHWDEELETVPPDVVAEETREIAQEYPQKRLIVHFMQPHYPFLNEKRNQLPDYRTFTGHGRIVKDKRDSIWELLERGDVNKREVFEAYRENFELVLPIALDLIKDLNGRSVLTSDHGNAFGERAFPIPLRVYGHKKGYRMRCLIRVPWIKFGGEPKQIESATIQQDGEPNTDLRERLRKLGYVK